MVMSLEETFETIVRRVFREELKSLSTEDRLLTPEQVAEYLGYSVHHVRRLKLEGRLKGFMLGDNSLRFRRSEVERYIQQREQAA